MPGPAKRTGAEKSIRVAVGSALERLTQDKPFTETVHKMAELFETALAENWGPPPTYSGKIEIGPRLNSRGQIEVGKHYMGVAIEEVDELPSETETRRFVIGHDEHTQEVVTEDELLKIASDQFPAGLVPVGLDDDADELPREVDTGEVFDRHDDAGYGRTDGQAVSTSPMEPEDDEDLSYLV